MPLTDKEMLIALSKAVVEHHETVHRGMPPKITSTSQESLDAVNKLLDANERLRVTYNTLRSLHTKTSETSPLVKEIAKIRREKEAAIQASDFDRAADLRDVERDLVKKRNHDSET
jgi:benzoyl-CoA reductase/2-hydroxyglutaryl-CoA dehydratase subunit BcrC/BadD/HgdB